MTKRVTLTIAILLMSMLVYGDELNEAGFAYDGGAISYLAQKQGDATGKFVAVWNPKASDKKGQLLKPGLKIIFWGHGVGCESTMSSGPVTTNAEWLFKQAEKKTGIPIDQKHLDHRWAPTGGEGCSTDSRKLVGPSFVHINEISNHAGIGIFSSSGGSDPDNEFFRQIDKRGQNNAGHNQDIQGTFVVFRFEQKGKNIYFPFGKSKNLSNGKTLVIDSIQNVESFNVPSSADHNSKAPNQVKQQIALTFLNDDCFAKRDSKSLCQLKYLFHTAVFREGVSDWEKELWFDKATLLLDPAQNGIPVLHGPIKAIGVNTLSKDNKTLDVWKSLGSKTLHTEFEPTRFVIEINYGQFISALMLSSARLNNTSANSISKEVMVRAFGKSWDIPASWRLLDISVAQEVHNNSIKASWIGGGVASLSVTSRDP